MECVATGQRFVSVPFVLDIAHQQRAIKMDSSGRKNGSVLEEGRFNTVNCEWLEKPVEGTKFETVERAAFELWVGSRV